MLTRHALLDDRHPQVDTIREPPLGPSARHPRDGRYGSIRHAAISVGLVLLALGLAPAVAVAQEGDRLVRGVLFYSPTCGHCEYVLAEGLPPVFERFGGAPRVVSGAATLQAEAAFHLLSNGTLELLLVDVSTEAGASMFLDDGERLGIARPGVPRLDVGATFLTGSVDIPEQLPGIIQAGLAGEGIAWPSVPGIEAALGTLPAPTGDGPAMGAGPVAQEARPGADADRPGSSGQGSVWDPVARDPIGNGAAILVLGAMLASLVLIPLLVRRGSLTTAPVWLVPALAVLGLGVAAYMAGIEATAGQAVCGPVGDCNAVQQSEYARLAGIPIGFLGSAAYLAILVAWAASRVSGGPVAAAGSVLAAGIALGGTAFSIYLTFLEPFVIGATCMWCLTSALTITGLAWATAGTGWAAIGDVRGRLRSSA